jgi:hypothetical protein
MRHFIELTLPPLSLPGRMPVRPATRALVAGAGATT